MVEIINCQLSAREQYQLRTEYQDVMDALKELFPDTSETELEQALSNYLTANQGKDLNDLDAGAMINEISSTLNVAITAEAAAAIKDEWEALTQDMDIGVSDLVSLLDTYDSEEVLLTREYLIMLWQMLQDELEQAVGDEATAVAEANKKMREDAFDEFIEKKIEALESSRKKGIFNKILKWAGVVAAVIGAAVSYVVSAAAILTGVGAGAGVALCVGATIMIALAVAGTISAGLDEAGKNWQLGSLLGQGIVKALNSMGANIDEEQFANWFAFAVQMTLTIVAVVCTLGGSMASAAGAAASAGTSAAKTAGSVATAASKVTSALDKTKTILNALDIITSIGKGALEVATGVITLQDAYTQADFVKIKALLEKLSDIQNMEQELAAQIFQMIFDNMRANVSNATDTILQDMEMMSGLNLNRA